ncbi:MAG: hypothetical protein M3P08_05415 [Thermoproteota archaeon]|nr:hypothetical protein [Thermoproteota archaeon]
MYDWDNEFIKGKWSERWEARSSTKRSQTRWDVKGATSFKAYQEVTVLSLYYVAE